MLITIPVLILVGVLMWNLYPGRKLGRDRKITLLLLIILPASLAAVGLVAQLQLYIKGILDVSELANVCVLILAYLILVELLFTAGLLIIRQNVIAKDLVFGVCITVVIWIVTFGLLSFLAGI